MYLSLVSLWLSYIEQQCHGSDTTRNFRCILWIQYIVANTCRWQTDSFDQNTIHLYCIIILTRITFRFAPLCEIRELQSFSNVSPWFSAEFQRHLAAEQETLLCIVEKRLRAYLPDFTGIRTNFSGFFKNLNLGNLM